MVNPQDATNEGGEIRLDGAAANPAWFVDNNVGTCRLHDGTTVALTAYTNGDVAIGGALTFPDVSKQYTAFGQCEVFSAESASGIGTRTATASTTGTVT